MTLPVPLAVRLMTARGDRHVTKDLRDLSYRLVDPGGYGPATLSFERPLQLTPDELAYFGRVIVYDDRNAAVRYEGRVEDLGRSAGTDGQIRSLNVLGPSAHVDDDAFPYIGIDSGTEGWRYGAGSTPNGRGETDDRSEADTDPSWILSFPAGADVTSFAPVSTAGIQYRRIYDSGQELGRVRCDVDNGASTANYSNRLVTRPSPLGTGTVRESVTWSTTATTLVASRGGGNNIPAGEKVATLRIQRLAGGTATVASDDQTAEFWNIVVRPILRNIDGSTITSGYTSNWVRASEIVTDLLGRGHMPMYDNLGARVDTTSYQIEQLAYPDGVRVRQILDDLLELEPGFTWAVWEANDAGKYRFEWRARSNSIRYDATVADGFDSPGAGDSLNNKALIRFIDWAGRRRTMTITQPVAALDDAGIVRALEADAGDNINSAANATRIGESQLIDHAVPLSGGTLTVTRPILDRYTGKMVSPWEIIPGELVMTMDNGINMAAFGSTLRDGTVVFRINAVDFSASDGAATLELDTEPRTLARAIAKANRIPQRRRRR